METGQQFAKRLRPAGCVAVLVLAVIATALMFSAKGSVVEGYSKPETDEYYAQHLDELLTEIETNLLPKAGIENVELSLSDGVVAVTGPKEDLHDAYLAIIHYFDEDLFEFTEAAQ